MSIGTIGAMVFVGIATVALPLGIMAFLRRRGGSWRAFLAGAGTFVLFALVLEPVLHSLILRSETGAVIQGNILLYGLYGGLMAGLFEETGRFLAFRFMLRKQKAGIMALSYGMGHGGVEAFLLVGLTMMSNLALGLAYTGGDALSPEMAAAAEALVSTPAGMFLWAGFERVSAIMLHMANSVLVFAAVTTSRRWLFPAAILTHTAVNFAAVVSAAFLPVAATEGIVFLISAAAAAWAAGIYKTLSVAEA